MRRMRFCRTLAFAAATVWVAGVAVGFAALERYAVEAGPARGTEARAVAFLRAQQQPGRALLAMAVHPRCPCTDASLAELGDLLARSRGACDALIVEYLPSSPPPDWPAPGDHRELGGVRARVQPDRNGDLALAMGALTSGHVVFLDASGTLRFEGGITLARGHRGRAPAHEAILDALQGSAAAVPPAPVFGCALQEKCAAILPR